MNARRAASLAGTVAVTAIAAVASYDHMRALALTAGQSPSLAALLPLSVDGMVLVATVALGDGRRSRWSAWLAFFIGVAASLAANVMVAAPDAISRAVSAWPAVALLLTVEVLARSGGQSTATAATDVLATATRTDTSPPRSTVSATPRTPAASPVTPRPPTTVAASTSPVAATVTATVSAARTPRPEVEEAVGRVAAMLADRPALTGADVAVALDVSARTARRYLAAARDRVAAGLAATVAA